MPGVLGRRRAIRSARYVVRAKLRHARQHQGDGFAHWLGLLVFCAPLVCIQPAWVLNFTPQEGALTVK